MFRFAPKSHKTLAPFLCAADCVSIHCSVTCLNRLLHAVGAEALHRLPPEIRVVRDGGVHHACSRMILTSARVSISHKSHDAIGK